MKSRTQPDTGGRPSVEASLHEMLEWRLVVHTHPFAVNALTCGTQGEQTARELFGDEALWVPYTDPGYRLAKLMEEKLKAYRAAHRASRGSCSCRTTGWSWARTPPRRSDRSPTR